VDRLRQLNPTVQVLFVPDTPQTTRGLTGVGGFIEDWTFSRQRKTARCQQRKPFATKRIPKVGLVTLDTLLATLPAKQK